MHDDLPVVASPPGTSPPLGRRGTLRVYLGVAPGVGKTYAMLAEGRRRADRGTDVVVAVVDTHDRPRTEALLGSLERIAALDDGQLDVASCLARHPGVLPRAEPLSRRSSPRPR